MLKMFSTQLHGLFKRIYESEQYAIEDTARLLAQAKVGEGTIFLYGTDEMGVVPLEATSGAEPFHESSILYKEDLENLSTADRVLIFTRFSNDRHAVELGEKLAHLGVPFAAVSTKNEDEDGIDSIADVYIDLKITKGLLPTETGERTGLPTSMAALFVYHGIKFTIDEMLAEYED